MNDRQRWPDLASAPNASGSVLSRLRRAVGHDWHVRVTLMLLVLGVVSLSWGGFVTIGALAEASQASHAAARSITVIDATGENLVRLESSFRGYALTGDPGQQQNWQEAREALRGNLGELRQQVQGGAPTIEHIDRLEQLAGAWTEAHLAAGVLSSDAASHARLQADAADRAAASGRSAQLAAIQTALAALHAAESSAVEGRGTTEHRLLARTQVLLPVAGLFAVGSTLALVLLLLGRTGRLVEAKQALEHENEERRAAEAALERLGRRHRLILESAGQGILELNAAGTVTFVNPTAAKLLGLTGRHAAGVHFNEVLFAGQPDPEQAHAADEAMATMHAITAALRDGTVHTDSEGTFLLVDGRALPVELTASPIREHGTITGAVLTFGDATQRREIARMKSEFVSVVSHELRTPLTSIRGSLGLLATGRLGAVNDTGRRMLEIAVQNTDRLVRLINDILDVERTESGNVVLDIRWTGTTELVREAVHAVHGAAERRNIAIESATEPLDIQVDSDRIVQTLTNLLGNALKFSPHDSVIRVSARRVGGEVVFEVSDQGRGIQAQHLEVIFDRFRQVDSSDARNSGGSGLGLAISRGIVMQHGGRIWAESEVGRGSTFRFALPLIEAQTAVADAGSAAGDGIDKPLVLVCDDDADVLRVVQTMLERNGYAVAVSTSGEEALRKASQLRPAALLLDLLMPGLDGYGTVARLRESVATKDLPIVIFSVLAQQDAVPPDVEGWVTKPADEAAVVTAVERAIRKRKPRHVLVVEDDLDLSRVLLEMLERNGIGARHAATGREAIRLSDETEPDMIILDLVLPEGDGFTVVDWLRRHDRLRGAPLVVYSAREVDPSERERLRLGPTEFVTKGRVAPEEFERRVIHLLRHAVSGRDEEAA
jgi:PAS domain S-box-containing protein